MWYDAELAERGKLDDFLVLVSCLYDTFGLYVGRELSCACALRVR